MSKRALILVIFCACIANGQAALPTTGGGKPECRPGAICFSGKVSEGQEFRKTLNNRLEFVLKAGWTITVVPTHPNGKCGEFASLVTPPYRYHGPLEIDMGYAWTAEEETKYSPREFKFVTNCADYRTESERLTKVLWPYSFPKKEAEDALAKLGTSPLGIGRLWITSERISHSKDTADKKTGKIQSMSFTVEITLPSQ